MKLNLWDRICLAPDAPASGAGGAGGQGSAPATPQPSTNQELAATLYGDNDASKTPEGQKSADGGTAGTTPEGKPGAGSEAGKDGKKEGEAAGKSADAPAGDAPQLLTEERKAELAKAIDEAKTDEEKAAAKTALDKANADDVKAKEIAEANAPFDEGKVVMPDGVEIDSALLKEVAPEFKSMGLGQKAAQTVVDRYIKIKQSEAAAHAQTVKGWLDTAKADKRIGGDNWAKTETDGVKAIEAHAAATGDKSLIEALNLSGMGNHPGMISFAAWVGAMIKDDVPVASQSAASGKEDVLDVLYPGTPRQR